MIHTVLSGKRSISFEISDKNLISLVEPGASFSEALPEDIDRQLNDPLGSEGIKVFLKGCRRLLIIVNDHTRTTPTAAALSHLEAHLQNMDIRIMIASGSHDKPTISQIQKILAEYARSFSGNINFHDARNSSMVELGMTSRGTKVRVNGIIGQVDRIITINSVEPHYFAGYTGGRKSILPGIAAYETIEQNHALALEPEARILALDNNPVHEDMAEAAAMVTTPIFAINIVMTSRSGIYSLHAGDLSESFRAAVADAGKIYVQKVPSRADILLAFVKTPISRDLYQAQKGVENNRNVLKKKGIMILVSSCENGIGKDEFYRLLTSCTTPKGVFEKIRKGYVLGYHKAAKIVDFIGKHQLWMVTELGKDKLDQLGIRKFDSLDQAIAEALKIKGEDAGIIVNRDAGTTVPLLA